MLDVNLLPFSSFYTFEFTIFYLIGKIIFKNQTINILKKKKIVSQTDISYKECKNTTLKL